MGKKGGKFKRKENNEPVKKKSSKFDYGDEDMMNDEIDAFHKNRDVVPLNLDEDMEDSDEDNEHPVLDIEDDEDEDEDEDVEDEDTDDDDDDEEPRKGLAANIVRTQKYLRTKFGAAEDETIDDEEEEEEEKVEWGKKNPYGADVDYEPQSSDDEDAAEEEMEVLKLQRKKAKDFSKEDYGLEDTSEDETGRERTLEEILDHGKSIPKDHLGRGINEEDGMTYEIVEKDINALTKEEQMDLVSSSAPELNGLLPELKNALWELENNVYPILKKIEAQGRPKNSGMQYFEVKKLVLLSYCQALVFYLLLKSEGQPVRDHPVVYRLVEIRTLVDKIKEIDDNLPFDVEDIVNKDVNNKTIMKVVEEVAVLESDPLTNSKIVSAVSSENQAMFETRKAAELNILKSPKNKESQRKHQDKQVGIQSIEMLKIRASLEEKLKQKGLFSSIAPKNGRTKEHLQPMNRQLETLDDFVDEPMEIDGVANGRGKSSKISQQVALRPNKRKVISGDDDLPRRDDIGERRRKHELRVLAGAGIKSGDGMEDETGNISSNEDDHVDGESDADSDLEYYNEVERKHSAKLAAKSDKYNRTSDVSSLPEDTVVDGKRHITRQIEKNRGLTRARKKLIKNPRKKYRLQHKKKTERRKGQVRDIRKPTGPYGGEASGINAKISRSVRFKN